MAFCGIKSDQIDCMSAVACLAAMCLCYPCLRNMDLPSQRVQRGGLMFNTLKSSIFYVRSNFSGNVGMRTETILHIVLKVQVDRALFPGRNSWRKCRWKIGRRRRRRRRVKERKNEASAVTLRSLCL